VTSEGVLSDRHVQSRPITFIYSLFNQKPINMGLFDLQEGQTLLPKVVELDKENQKMVVMCDADNVGWGTETMEGLVGDWLKEGNKVLGWSSNKMGELVSGTVTEFRIFLDVNGIKCVMTNSNLVMQVVDKVDTVAEMVIFVNQVARVGGMW